MEDSKYNISQDFNYYANNRSYLYTTYPNRYLVIKNRTIQGNFSSFFEAYQYGLHKFKTNDFLVQHCPPE